MNEIFENQEQYVISIMSRDRVGIVYEISKAISELQGNIADIRQSVLCGYFTMILLASFPKEVTYRSIEQKFAEVDSHSDTFIDVAIKKVEIESILSIHRDFNSNYVMTATGDDRIGFVATISSFCVKHNINIVDLSTTASEGTYAMILIVDLTRCPSIQIVRKDLEKFSDETGLKVMLQHYDIFRAINEINLPVN